MLDIHSLWSGIKSDMSPFSELTAISSGAEQRSDELSRQPFREPRVRAVGKPDRRRRVYVESEAAVDALELMAARPAVGESGQDEDPGHEAESSDRAGLLGFDFERFLSELLGSGTAFGGGVPNGPLRDLPEAMRTVISTRQGESLRRLSSCPSVS